MAVDLNLMSEIDFSAIVREDPSLEQGLFQLVYASDLAVEIEMDEMTTLGDQYHRFKILPGQSSLEALKLRVYLEGEIEAPRNIKIELLSEDDVQFYYSQVIDEQTYY